MSKEKKRVSKVTAKEESKVSSNFSFDKIIPAKYQTPFAIAVIFILFLIYFAPMYFGGKTFQSGDIVTSLSMTKYVENHDGDYTLWNPYIFGGIPAYALSVGYKWFNLIYVIFGEFKSLFTSLFSVNYVQWTLYLIILGITTYFLAKYKTQNRLVSLFVAISTAFSTGIIVLLYIGHVTKLVAICWIPLIFLMLLKFKKKITLLDFAILTIALQLAVQGWHVQIIFYLLFAVAIYFIYYFVYSLIKKEKDLTFQILKSVGVFTAATVIALLIQSDNFTQIWEYTPYSTRGAKSIVETSQPATAAQTESDLYTYNTNWSFSPGEVLTFVVPSFYGFGNSTYNGPLTQNQDYKVNTYFGQMPFVDVAMYMGVIIFFLAILGIILNRKDPFTQFLAILSFIALLISFGRTFPIAYDLMYYYLPFFDKFRAPSMILILVQLSFPLLAGLALSKIFTLKNENDIQIKSIIKYVSIGATAIFAISLLLNSSIKSWFTSRMIEGAKNAQQAEYFKQISDYASSMFSGDLIIAFLLTSLTFWLIYFYLINKLNKDFLIILLIVFSTFDLWRIDNRGKEYIEDQNIEQAFIAPDYVNIIKNQNDKEPFRILNLKQDGSLGSISNSSNYNAYFLLEDLFGYSGIKPRAYQDFIDVLGNPVNPTFWRMLNTKYIIFDKPVNFPGLTEISRGSSSIVYENETALPRAYFVDSVANKPALEILNSVKNNSFDPKHTAFVEGENLHVEFSDSTAYANITSYKNELIAMDVNASGNNFLFVGNTFTKGWKAEIDGQETKIYKANHGFLGIIVPNGKHKVEFKFAPTSFYITKYLALGLSGIIILLLIINSYFHFKKRSAKLN